jgi:hypothetical protein
MTSIPLRFIRVLRMTVAIGTIGSNPALTMTLASTDRRFVGFVRCQSHGCDSK